jgi:acyl-CoA synthetase (AMP-forming)/AMP-acid ligase II
VTSLGFEILDRHVVEGRGDVVACSDETGSMTYAKLLERAAELGGGLHLLGVGPGDHVEIELPAGNLLVATVAAVIRLGAIPAAHGSTRIFRRDGEAWVHRGDQDTELDLVRRAGRSQPAPALTFDEPGFGDVASNAFEDIVESLLSGSPVV